VARRAEVGIGTLYGHFPTRRALIATLLAERNRDLFEFGDRLIGGTVTADTIGEWVRAVVQHASTYQGLTAVLAESLGDDSSELQEACLRMNEIGAELVARAGRMATLAPSTTTEDIFTLINAAAWTREYAGPDRAERLITLVLEGIRASNSRTVTGQPPGSLDLG
jgi:AcrR family transcriptional regulator